MWVALSPVLLDKLNMKTPFLKQPNESDAFVSVAFSPEEHYVISNPLEYDPFEIFQPLPAYSTVLGICQDGLPLVLDLNDPDPGAILISGGRQTGKTRLLRSILFSACTTNNIEQLYFYLVTPEPGNHGDLEHLAHCYGLFSSYDKAACELVVELADLVEQRKSSRHLGVKCVLAIENLYEFIKHQDFDVVNHLIWLYRFGANNGIRLISTIETDRSNLIEPDLLNEQKTHILSGSERWSLPDGTFDRRLPGYIQGYRTLIGNEWVEFWLPSTNY